MSLLGSIFLSLSQSIILSNYLSIYLLSIYLKSSKNLKVSSIHNRICQICKYHPCFKDKTLNRCFKNLWSVKNALQFAMSALLSINHTQPS